MQIRLHRFSRCKLWHFQDTKKSLHQNKLLQTPATLETLGSTSAVQKFITCERLQLSEFLIRLPSFRGSDYAETVVFGFRVDSEGVSSVFARVCVLWGSFLLQQHRSEIFWSYGDWLESLNLELVMRVGVLFILRLHSGDSRRHVNFEETRATVFMKAISQFWDFWRQCYGWSYILPCSLEADEVRDYFFSAYIDADLRSCGS